MTAERLQLPIRIVVEDPIPGLGLALQRGKAGQAVLEPPRSRSAEAVVFDLDLIVEGRLENGRPRLFGPYVQGPPDTRFVYLCVGGYAGQADAPWNGRVKVQLSGLGWDAIETLPPGGRLAVRIPGRSPKGGPLLASVAQRARWEAGAQ